MAFFIPGVRAINIYMKLLNDTVFLVLIYSNFYFISIFFFFLPHHRSSTFHQCQNKGKAALLPEPPSDTVFHQLQNLTKQNPACKCRQPHTMMDNLHLIKLLIFLYLRSCSQSAEYHFNANSASKQPGKQHRKLRQLPGGKLSGNA